MASLRIHQREDKFSKKVDFNFKIFDANVPKLHFFSDFRALWILVHTCYIKCVEDVAVAADRYNVW